MDTMWKIDKRGRFPYMIVPPLAGESGTTDTKGHKRYSGLTSPLDSKSWHRLSPGIQRSFHRKKRWIPGDRFKKMMPLPPTLPAPFFFITSPLFQTLKKRFPLEENVFLLFFNSLADDLFAFVVTAYRAYMMRFFQCMALRAFHKTRNSQLPVSTSLITTGSGTFCLRNRHS